MASDRIEALRARFRSTEEDIQEGSTEDWYLPAPEDGWARFTVLNPGPGAPAEPDTDRTAYEVGLRYVRGIRAARFEHDVSGEEDISPSSSSPIHGWLTWTDSRLVVCWTMPEFESFGWASFDMAHGELPEEDDDDWSPSAFTPIARRITEAVLENETATSQGTFD